MHVRLFRGLLLRGREFFTIERFDESRRNRFRNAGRGEGGSRSRVYFEEEKGLEGSETRNEGRTKVEARRKDPRHRVVENVSLDSSPSPPPSPRRLPFFTSRSIPQFHHHHLLLPFSLLLVNITYRFAACLVFSFFPFFLFFLLSSSSSSSSFFFFSYRRELRSRTIAFPMCLTYPSLHPRESRKIHPLLLLYCSFTLLFIEVEFVFPIIPPFIPSRIETAKRAFLSSCYEDIILSFLFSFFVGLR